jgi:hypothetical protein
MTKKYNVKIEITGCCSEPIGEMAKNIAQFLKNKGYGTVNADISRDIPDSSYDGMISDESILIYIKPITCTAPYRHFTKTGKLVE